MFGDPRGPKRDRRPCQLCAASVYSSENYVLSACYALFTSGACRVGREAPYRWMLPCVSPARAAPWAWEPGLIRQPGCIVLAPPQGLPERHPDDDRRTLVSDGPGVGIGPARCPTGLRGRLHRSASSPGGLGSSSLPSPASPETRSLSTCPAIAPGSRRAALTQGRGAWPPTPVP